MFRPPFLARVAAGAAVYVLEETRRLPAAAVKLPVTAVSQLLQSGMHMQQFVTSLAIKGDSVFDRITNRAQQQPEWATFDEDEQDDPPPVAAPANRDSGFDRFESDPAEVELALQETLAGLRALQNGSAAPEPVQPSDPTVHAGPADDEDRADAAEPAVGDRAAAPQPAGTESAAIPRAGEPDSADEPSEDPELPAVAARYDYPNMTLAQLRGRLRTLTVADLVALLDYEQRTRDRAPFVTMLSNRIATVRAQ